MKNNKRLKVLIFICLWLGVIFYFSSKNAEVSSSQSELVVNILNYLRVKIPFLNSIIGYLETNYSLFYIVRKCAHMFIFMILQILVFIYCRTVNMSLIKSGIISIVCVFIYAGFDEFHQLFIPGRSGSFSDVLIDLRGGIIGLFISLSVECIKGIYLQIKKDIKLTSSYTQKLLIKNIK